MELDSDFGMVRWYQSLTTGEIVRTRREVFRVIVQNFFTFHFLDWQWRTIWLYEGTEVL